MVLDSTAIAYPYRRHTRRSARRQSGQHGGPDPNFRAYSVRAGTPAAHPFRLCRSQACDPRAWRPPEPGGLDTPTRYGRRAS